MVGHGRRELRRGVAAGRRRERRDDAIISKSLHLPRGLADGFTGPHFAKGKQARMGKAARLCSILLPEESVR
jgi:hypothetical protein